MPWGRIDDSFYDHPKVDDLGRYRLPCVGLYVLALSYSNRHLTDGFIPFDRVRKLGGTKVLAERLVRVGLWDLLVDGYRIHDFLDYNDSSASVLANRTAARERMRVLRNMRRTTGRCSGNVRNARPVPSFNPPTPLVDKSKKRSDA